MDGWILPRVWPGFGMMYSVHLPGSRRLGDLQASVLGQVVGNSAPSNPHIDPVVALQAGGFKAINLLSKP